MKFIQFFFELSFKLICNILSFDLLTFQFFLLFPQATLSLKAQNPPMLKNARDSFVSLQKFQKSRSVSPEISLPSLESNQQIKEKEQKGKRDDIFLNGSLLNIVPEKSGFQDQEISSLKITQPPIFSPLFESLQKEEKYVFMQQAPKEVMAFKDVIISSRKRAVAVSHQNQNNLHQQDLDKNSENYVISYSRPFLSSKIDELPNIIQKKEQLFCSAIRDNVSRFLNAQLDRNNKFAHIYSGTETIREILYQGSSGLYKKSSIASIEDTVIAYFNKLYKHHKGIVPVFVDKNVRDSFLEQILQTFVEYDESNQSFSNVIQSNYNKNYDLLMIDENGRNEQLRKSIKRAIELSSQVMDEEYARIMQTKTIVMPQKKIMSSRNLHD
jgi:hypothetical protein